MALNSFFVLLCILFISFYLLYQKNVRHKRKLIANIPVVAKLPWKAIISHFFSKDKGSNYTLYNVAERIAGGYEDLCSVWFGPILLIDLRHPEYIKRVLFSDKCLDRADFYSFPYQTGLLYSNGDTWKKHRKIINPAFKSKKLNQFLPIVNEKARKLITFLDLKAEENSLNIVRFLSALTLESLLQTSFGLDKDFINNPYDKFFTIVKKEAAEIGNTITNAFNLFIPHRRRKNKFTKFCEKISQEAKNESENSFNDGDLSFIEILLKNRKNLTDDEIQDEVSTMILAGNASTALTMSSILLMLAMHPEVQQKVFEEICDVFVGEDVEVDSESINKLKYLDCVVKETMRLFPVAPVIGRKATEDLKLDETYTIPRGANVAIRIIDVQRNPRFWGDDASQFNPDRFLPENISKIHPFAFLPFSQGSRNCIGYKYASNAIKIVVTHIVRNFKVTTPLKFDELKLEISFVLRISQNYIVNLKRR